VRPGGRREVFGFVEVSWIVQKRIRKKNKIRSVSPAAGATVDLIHPIASASLSAGEIDAHAADVIRRHLHRNELIMKIGFFGKQNAFALEMLRRLQLDHSRDDFSPWEPGEEAPSTELEVIIAFDRVVSKEIEAQAKLGLVQMASAGYEGVDVEAATKAGVWVGSAPTTKTGNGESVAEVALLLMLAASRRLNEQLSLTHGSPQNRSEKWEENMALFGKTACIVGLGGIGGLLIERLRGFGMILTGVDNHPDHAPKGVRAYGHDELKIAAAEADYLVLAIPATKENENMIDESILGEMKNNAVLVNVARGSLVDESALLAAVKSGHLYGAGLDVVKDEPVSEGNPLLMERRIFVTPHIAGSTDVMLDGTVKYLGEVLAEYRNGLRSADIINNPIKPRVLLREYSNGDKSHNKGSLVTAG
jgi:phosphoglycerate dehydrogenase-like enzyme